MSNLTVQDINKKRKVNPIFKGLPSRLKDPTNYKKTERDLADTLKTEHKHKKPSEWMKCTDCQKQLLDKRKLMKRIGFKNISQYLEWRKVMEIMTAKKSFKLN